MPASPTPEWIVQDPDAATLARLAELPACRDLAPLVQRLLCLRGYTEPDAVVRFLSPKLRDLSDPFLLPDMDKAVARLLKAIDAREKIVLYGDYDVDGVTSLTLMKTILGAYGADAATFLPHRTEEGYGISEDGLDRCLEEHRPDLLVAVDCGTSSALQIARLRGLGVDAVILDHHECPADEVPDCAALVNPKLCENGRRFDYFCSAGVVFKVGHALLKTRPLPAFDLRDFLDIAALGTLADIVPLVDENRLLVRRGLIQLDRTLNPGLRELKRVASVGSPCLPSDVGFRLGPRLNASGRIDTAQSSLDLPLSTDEQSARLLAEGLDAQNRERQAIERQTFKEAQELLAESFDPQRDFCIVLGSENWHPGVVGIVASRMMRAYHRPAFIVAIGEDGIGKGSGRSVEGVSLVEAIAHCRPFLVNGGGHDMAAGITIAKERIPEFRQALGTCVMRSMNGGGIHSLRPKLVIDTVAELRELSLDLLDSYEQLQPFGCANPEPLFMARGLAPAAEPEVMKERHLKLRLYQGGQTRDAIFFGGAIDPLPRPPWDVAFHISRNTFRGRQSLQITVQGIRAACE
ncbi:single-stranded-DNA-specific exonuclease RecJ [soil metagenome]